MLLVVRTTQYSRKKKAKSMDFSFSAPLELGFG
jgi:hypothetical protein